MSADASRKLKPLRSPIRWLSARRHRKPEALPVVLGRRRIYIVPTGFGAGFAAILFVMLIGALNYSNNAAILLTCLLGAAAAGSLLTTFRDLDGLRLDAVHTGAAHAGESVRVALDFAVATRARHCLCVEIHAQSVSFNVADAGNRTLELYLPTTQRGWMELPRLSVASTWPFGMFRAWAWLAPDRAALIYPRVESEGAPPPGAGPADQRRQRRERRGGDEVASLRAYRAGDPVKLVAWKASARHEGLLVCEFQRPTGRHEWQLDFDNVAAMNHEAGISRLARWVEEAHAAGIRWSLRLPGQTLGPDDSREHYQQCMRALALLP